VVSQRIVISLVTIIIWCGLALAGEEYRYEYQKIVEVKSGVELTVINPTGDIKLIADPESSVRINAVKKTYADSREEAEVLAGQIQITVTDLDGHITVDTKSLAEPKPSSSFLTKVLGGGGRTSQNSVDFTITVPTDCNVSIRNSSGNIEVMGIRGRLDLSGMAGDMAIQDILGNVDISTSSGEIKIKNIDGNVTVKGSSISVTMTSVNGNVDIRNGSGNVVGEYVIGDVVVSQENGTVDLTRLEGDIRVTSATGRVRVEQEFGALDVSTESGDIDVTTELNSPKDYFVETVSGSIRFMVPEASGGKIDLEAGSCEIDTQIPIAIDSFSRTRISGRFGTGGPKISLATTSGDITLGEF
jgi:Toastrack DUF4097